VANIDSDPSNVLLQETVSVRLNQGDGTFAAAVRYATETERGETDPSVALGTWMATAASTWR